MEATNRGRKKHVQIGRQEWNDMQYRTGLRRFACIFSDSGIIEVNDGKLSAEEQLLQHMQRKMKEISGLSFQQKCWLIEFIFEQLLEYRLIWQPGNSLTWKIRRDFQMLHRNSAVRIAQEAERQKRLRRAPRVVVPHWELAAR